MMTISDYLIVMNDVRIADLKARLSEYLRKVKRGHAVTVLDRETPIARLVPYEADAASLPVRRPLPGAPKLQKVALPPPLHIRGDIVALLLEDREDGR
jgi:prevent-host-death family protein